MIDMTPAEAAQVTFDGMNFDLDDLPTNEQLRRRMWMSSESTTVVVDCQDYDVYTDGERLCEVNSATLQEKSISRNTLPAYIRSARKILLR